MKQLDYTPLAVIMETWERARFHKKDFDAEFGVVALEKFCKLEPGVISPNEKDFYRPSNYADFVENIFQILGPDIEFIMTFLSSIAKSFEAHGGKAEYLLSIGDSIVHSLEQCLGRHLNQEEIEAYDEVFNAICREICKSLKGAPPAPVWHHHANDNHRSKKATNNHAATKALKAFKKPDPVTLPPTFEVEEKKHVPAAQSEAKHHIFHLFGKRRSSSGEYGSVHD